ncbi:MAG: hypothetical protein GY788_23590 [bacterium]|nr:hypothetical protein [bacterium]
MIVPIGITVVTKPQGIASISLVEADAIEEQDVIANFRTPGDRARLAALDIEWQRVVARRAALESETLRVNAALDREKQDIRYEISQKQRFRQDISNIEYQRRIEQLDIVTDWAREERELEEALLNARFEAEASAINQQIATKAEQRAVTLKSRRVMSDAQLDEHVLMRVAAESLASSTRTTANALKERLDTLNEHYGKQLEAFDVILSELNQKAGEIDEQLPVLRAREVAVQMAIDDDLKRALRVRAHRIAELGKEEEGVKAKKRILVEEARILAPYDGEVIYRHASPSIARAGEPLLIVARTEPTTVDPPSGPLAQSDAAPGLPNAARRSGFYVQIRVRANEMAILDGHDQPVRFALQEPVLTRLFSGRLIESVALENDAGRGLAIFRTELPPDVVARVARDQEPVDVAMVWQPPLIARTEVQVGVTLFVLGLLGLAAGVTGESQGRETPSQPANQPAAGTDVASDRETLPAPMLALAALSAKPANPAPQAGGGDAFEGHHEHMIRSLAVKLKDDLECGSVENELLKTLEWMIDRYHVCAVKVLTQEFSGDVATMFDLCAVCSVEEDTRARVRSILDLAQLPQGRYANSAPVAEHG